jgi:hypothetical protein
MIIKNYILVDIQFYIENLSESNDDLEDEEYEKKD